MRIQARITLPAPLRDPIDALRMRWNPEVATGNPAHLTIVYHDEAPDEDLLQARLAAACRVATPFRLVLGGVERFAEPDAGAFLAVSDPEGGVARLRCAVLVPPFTARARFGLHVTLLHPAHGHRLEDAWPALSELGGAAEFVADRVDVIAGRGADTQTLASLALGSGAI